MVGHLHDTRQQLEEYAENLEDMVRQRTQALEASQHQLQEKITARNQELHTLNTIAELITRSVQPYGYFAPSSAPDPEADPGPGRRGVPAPGPPHPPGTPISEKR